MKSKRCVITGTSKGLGLCLAREFAGAGYDVVGIDSDPRPIADRQSMSHDSGSVHFLKADLANHQELALLTRQLAQGPPVDVLIHNAGTNLVGRFEQCDLAEQDRIIEVNLIAPMILTSGLMNRRAIADSGSLVFISSLCCQVSYPGAAVYAASKSGLASYASSLAADSSLHVLTVYPGAIRTEMARRCSPDPGNEARRMPPEQLARRISSCVRKRRRTLVPGLGNRCLALLGNCWPAATERGMKKLIFERLK